MHTLAAAANILFNINTANCWKTNSHLELLPMCLTVNAYHSSTAYVVATSCCVKPHNCDSTTIRLRRKIDMFILFLLASNRVEWKQAGAIRRSRIVVESQ